MTRREETTPVRIARKNLDRSMEKLRTLVLDGTPAHLRRAAELAVEQGENRLAKALEHQTHVHQLADEREAELTRLAAEKSARIKAEYLIDHPDTSDSQYERIRNDVEARFDVANRHAAKVPARQRSTYRQVL